MAKKEEVTSKVYKAVKKDGKCVLVKKQRAKPKPKAKTNIPKPPTSLAPRNPVQRTLNLPSKEQIIATQQPNLISLRKFNSKPIIIAQVQYIYN